MVNTLAPTAGPTLLAHVVRTDVERHVGRDRGRGDDDHSQRFAAGHHRA